MATPYVALEANRIDAEANYGALYPEMGAAPNVQYRPAQYATQPPGGAPTGHHHVPGGYVPVNQQQPLYTAGGVRQFAKKSKSNTCIVICCCICCLIVVAAVVVGILFGVASARCTVPQQTGTLQHTVTGWSGVKTITVTNMETLFGTVTIVPQGFGNFTFDVSVQTSASDLKALGQLSLNVNGEGSSALVIEVLGGGNRWNYLQWLFACDRANMTIKVPATLTGVDWTVNAINNVISATNLKANTALLKTTSGAIHVSGGSMTTLSTEIVNGATDLKNGVFDTVDIKGVNSPVSVTGTIIAKSASVVTVNGPASVTALNAGLDGAVTVKSTNGPAEAEISKILHGTYDVKTVSGSATLTCGSECTNDSGQVRTHVTGTINGAGGKGSVDVSTVNGAATLKFD